MFSGASEDEECVSRILPEKLKLQLLRSCSLILDWNIRWRTATALLFENRGDTAMCWSAIDNSARVCYTSPSGASLFCMRKSALHAVRPVTGPSYRGVILFVSNGFFLLYQLLG